MSGSRPTALVLCAIALAACSTGSPSPDPARQGQPAAESGQSLAANPHFAGAEGEYGFSETNPILVGHLAGITPTSERLYLERLRGPEGQAVEYRRVGSCCHFSTPNGVVGRRGLLDIYLVHYRGLGEPVKIYLNMYDPGTDLKAPSGFTLSP